MITTSTATSGDSYYGDSGVHLLSSDGMVSCLFEGPVSDAAWRPQPALASLDAAGRKRRRPRAQFVVVAGKQPPQPTLYDAEGTELQKLERRYANTVAWSPNGETLCLAGFGNMAGKMFFEGGDPMDNPAERASDSDAVLTPLGACQASAPSQFGWTADGSFFVTACTFPRMRQGNGYEVWDRCGNRCGFCLFLFFVCFLFFVLVIFRSSFSVFSLCCCRVFAEFPAAVGEMPVPGEPGKMVPIQVRLLSPRVSCVRIGAAVILIVSCMPPLNEYDWFCCSLIFLSLLIFLLPSHAQHELYQVTARPAPAGAFPVLPLPPKAARGGGGFAGGGGAAGKGKKGGAAKKSAIGAKPRAYIPPGARRAGGGSSMRMTLHGPEPGAAGAKKGGGEPKLSRSAQRRAKKREAAAAAKASGLSAAPAAPAAAPAPAAPAPAAPPAAPVDPVKTLKKLKKKLRQIKQLEEKVSGGAELSDVQQAKLATMSDVEAQIAALSVQ